MTTAAKKSARRAQLHNLKQKDEEVKSVKQRLTELETSNKEQLYKLRSELDKNDEEVKSIKQRLTELETSYKQQLNELRSDSNKNDEEVKSVKHSLTELETSYKRQLDELRLTKLETSYKEQLDELSSKLEQKDDELKSVKYRFAAEVLVSEQAGDTENMNNPVSKTRLTEMYQKLKLLQWPKIKDLLRSNGMSPELTKALIQKMFKDSSEEMETKKKQIEEVFSLIECSSGQSPLKIKQYRQLAIHNHQMFLLNSSKEDLLKTPLLEDEAQYSKDVMMVFRRLASECYWLGCLMALNNPPLHPDWQNHNPGMDCWNILPPLFPGL